MLAKVWLTFAKCDCPDELLSKLLAGQTIQKEVAGVIQITYTEEVAIENKVFINEEWAIS